MQRLIALLLAVLLTAGAAEAFVLIARALPARCPVVVHPHRPDTSATRPSQRDIPAAVVR